MSKIKITVDLKNGVAVLARILPCNKKYIDVAQITFIINNSQFTITDATVVRDYQKFGYGSMLLYTMMGIAKSKKKPIVLFSLVDAIPFYLKCGFMPISKFDNKTYCGISLKVANLNPEKSFSSQIDKCDLIWVPPNVDNVSIYL